MPAFRKQKTSVLNPASTSSQEQPVNGKQTTIQAPRISSHRQQDEPHHHSIYTEIHDYVHPLSLPAFRKQSLSTADPASTSSQERPVNYRRQKTPQATTNSSQRQQNGPHWQSNHTEIQGDNVHPPSLPAFRKQSLCNGDPTSTSSQKQAAKRKHKTPQGPKNKTRKSCTADSATVPDASSKQPARKQLVTTHVVSDDDGDSDEALITTSCDNLDCKALLLENKSLKDKIMYLHVHCRSILNLVPRVVF